MNIVYIFFSSSAQMKTVKSEYWRKIYSNFVIDEYARFPMQLSTHRSIGMFPRVVVATPAHSHAPGGGIWESDIRETHREGSGDEEGRSDYAHTDSFFLSSPFDN